MLLSAALATEFLSPKIRLIGPKLPDNFNINDGPADARMGVVLAADSSKSNSIRCDNIKAR